MRQPRRAAASPPRALPPIGEHFFGKLRGGDDWVVGFCRAAVANHPVVGKLCECARISAERRSPFGKLRGNMRNALLASRRRLPDQFFATGHRRSPPLAAHRGSPTRQINFSRDTYDINNEIICCYYFINNYLLVCLHNDNCY